MFQNDTCPHYEFPTRFVKRTLKTDKNFTPEVSSWIFFCTQLTVKTEYKLNVVQVMKFLDLTVRSYGCGSTELHQASKHRVR